MTHAFPQPFKLLSLPKEIIDDGVAANLEQIDAEQLRQSCKALATPSPRPGVVLKKSINLSNLQELGSVLDSSGELFSKIKFSGPIRRTKEIVLGTELIGFPTDDLTNLCCSLKRATPSLVGLNIEFHDTGEEAAVTFIGRFLKKLAGIKLLRIRNIKNVNDNEKQGQLLLSLPGLFAALEMGREFLQVLQLRADESDTVTFWDTDVENNILISKEQQFIAYLAQICPRLTQVLLYHSADHDDADNAMAIYIKKNQNFEREFCGLSAYWAIHLVDPWAREEEIDEPSDYDMRLRGEYSLSTAEEKKRCRDFMLHY